jgi:hypothetical protein
MTSLAKNLIAGSALLTLMLSPAFADSSSDGSQILNGQVSLHTSISTVQTVVDNVGQDVGVQSVAAGNVVDITTMNDTHVTSDQYTSSVEISSDIGARLTNIGGNVGVVNQAVCNSANVSTDPAVTAVNNTQQCNAIDPDARAYVDASNIGGSFSLANTAMGNAFETDTNAAYMPVNNTQINTSSVNARTTANVSSVAGTVSVSSAAIGNNAQIVHYSTEP